jgi:hypothetical protein
MLSELRAQLEALGEKATPGPWRFSPWHIEEGPSAVRAPEGWLLCNTPSDADAALIVALVNNLPAILTALQAAEAVEVAREEAAMADRARIVAWLRGETVTDYTDPQFDIGLNLADAIEAGKHQALAALTKEGV